MVRSVLWQLLTRKFLDDDIITVSLFTKMNATMLRLFVGVQENSTIVGALTATNIKQKHKA